MNAAGGASLQPWLVGQVEWMLIGLRGYVLYDSWINVDKNLNWKCLFQVISMCGLSTALFVVLILILLWLEPCERLYSIWWALTKTLFSCLQFLLKDCPCRHCWRCWIFWLVYWLRKLGAFSVHLTWFVSPNTGTNCNKLCAVNWCCMHVESVPRTLLQLTIFHLSIRCLK